MATTLTTKLTAAQAGTLVKGAYRVVIDQDTEELATGELDVSDVVIYAIPIPSNAVVANIECYNDDLDSHATPTLVVDIGLSAAQKFTSVTSGTSTVNAQNAVLDADILVDGVTTLQAATTNWTSLTPDSATNGPEDVNQEAWQLLGYDKDPNTKFNICITMSAGAATAVAGDVSIRVTYLIAN